MSTARSPSSTAPGSRRPPANATGPSRRISMSCSADLRRRRPTIPTRLLGPSRRLQESEVIMSAWHAYRDDIVFSFRKQKDAAEKALQQLDADQFFRKPGEHSNSVAIVVKHVAGNQI